MHSYCQHLEKQLPYRKAIHRFFIRSYLCLCFSILIASQIVLDPPPPNENVKPRSYIYSVDKNNLGKWHRSRRAANGISSEESDRQQRNFSHNVSILLDGLFKHYNKTFRPGYGCKAVRGTLACRPPQSLFSIWLWLSTILRGLVAWHTSRVSHIIKKQNILALSVEGEKKNILKEPVGSCIVRNLLHFELCSKLIRLCATLYTVKYICITFPMSKSNSMTELFEKGNRPGLNSITA